MSALPMLLLAIPLVGSGALFIARGPAGERAARRLAVIASGATLAIAVLMAAGFDYGTAARTQFELNAAWAPSVGLRFHLGVDGISLPLVVLTGLLSFLCALYSVKIVPAAGRVRAMLALLLLLEVGMLGSFVALDLVLFFVFFETVLVPMYFLIADWGDPETRRAAAYKFILYTLLGSAIMLLGLLIIYVQTGTLDMVALAAAGGDGISHGAQVLAFLALLIGFGVKAPMWPLHTWLPDAHTAAPTIGSVLLAGVLLKMGTYGLVRIAVPMVPEGAHEFAPLLGALAVVGILYGSLICLVQRDLKRLIAYSSVGHMGFVLLGIATLTPVGVNGALFANIGHGLITGLLFFLAGAIKDRHHSADMTVLGGGLYQRTPRLGALLAFAAVASLGLPGLAGFWGELLALFGSFDPAGELSRSLFLVLMVLAGLGTLLTAAYLLVMLRRVAMGVSPPRWRDPVLLGDVSAIEWASWTPLVVLIVAAGLWPRLLLDVTDPAVQALFGVFG
ncbi:MAG TPA: NADH-quinone oxidoreductase subunit M [Actinomycetes bacterium]|nr:NADH-quinone oxidoreductase subunit M [Actinomycetes bacterium]